MRPLLCPLAFWRSVQISSTISRIGAAFQGAQRFVLAEAMRTTGRAAAPMSFAWQSGSMLASSTFSRFVHLAVWRYCSQQGLDICNGNRVDDRLSRLPGWRLTFLTLAERTAMRLYYAQAGLKQSLRLGVSAASASNLPERPAPFVARPLRTSGRTIGDVDPDRASNSSVTKE